MNILQVHDDEYNSIIINPKIGKNKLKRLLWHRRIYFAILFLFGFFLILKFLNLYETGNLNSKDILFLLVMVFLSMIISYINIVNRIKTINFLEFISSRINK